MSFFDRFKREKAAEAAPSRATEPVFEAPAAAQSGHVFQASANTYAWTSFNDPRFKEFIRAGQNMVLQKAMGNSYINRGTRVLANSIGMLPLHLHHRDPAKGKAVDHPLYKVLHRKPNNWQTPFEFKQLMEGVLLHRGNAYAQIVSSRGMVMQLQPLAKHRVEPEQLSDWSIVYHVTSANGVKRTLKQEEVFHLRDMDLTSGLKGESRVDQAKASIDLADTIAEAAERLFDNGMMVGGSLSHPEKLSQEAYARLTASMAEKSGPDNAGKWLILEEGLKADRFAETAVDSQQVEMLKLMGENVSRIMGVPRPVLMMDETSWGSGIEALGQFLVQYGLAPEFANWEGAVSRMLSESDQSEYHPKFNAGALLRGSMKDQADYFAKALGSGGSAAWMKQNEVRDLDDLPSDKDGDKLYGPSSQKPKDTQNVAAPAA
jgi:HK97 family phage portal protein